MLDLQGVQTASTGALLERLATLRELPDRSQLQLVAEIGTRLERGHHLDNAKSQQGADAIEQVATAALETGRLDLAQTLIARLNTRFRSEPRGLLRVNYLAGMILEARGDLAGAKDFYVQKLKDDETDVAVRKRLAALHLSSPVVDLPNGSGASSTAKSSPNLAPYLSASLSRTEGIAQLVSYLDTYYLDMSSWLVLSSAYASLAQYAPALTALDHALVLAPHDPFVQLKYAETAYTAEKYDLAWKAFLRTIEMSTEKGDRVPLKGAARRAAMGAKLCSPRLQAAASAGKDAPPAPPKLAEMDLLLSRLLLEASSKAPTKAAGVEELRSWLGNGDATAPK